MDKKRTYIEAHVTGTTVTPKLYGALTSGMVGVPVTFFFGPDWDGLNKIAVFKGCTMKTRALVESNETAVPYEVLQSAGIALEIGVEGRQADGSIVYPSTMTRVGIIQEGADASADPGAEPSPTIYDEIMAEVNRIHAEGVKLAETEIDRIVGEYLTKNPPEPGYSPSITVEAVSGGYRITIQNKDSSQSFDILHGAKGDKGEPGTDGYTPRKGVDYYTEADKAEMVAAVLAALPAAEGVAF